MSNSTTTQIFTNGLAHYVLVEKCYGADRVLIMPNGSVDSPTHAYHMDSVDTTLEEAAQDFLLSAEQIARLEHEGVWINWPTSWGLPDWDARTSVAEARRSGTYGQLADLYLTVRDAAFDQDEDAYREALAEFNRAEEWSKRNPALRLRDKFGRPQY